MGPRIGRITECSVSIPWFSLLKGRQECIIRHGLHPHTGSGRLHLGIFHDGSENQLTFSGCIASVDDFGHSFILEQFLDGVQLCTVSPCFGFVFKRRWDVRQSLDGFTPIFERLIVVIHHLQFK